MGRLNYGVLFVSLKLSKTQSHFSCTTYIECKFQSVRTLPEGLKDSINVYIDLFFSQNTYCLIVDIEIYCEPQ